jgi:membrane-bound metal-dependent hydrolase YbcI (DUF457 family)
MSNYKGHIAGGAIAGTLYAAAITTVVSGHIDVSSYGTHSDWLFPAVLVVLSILFGLWPDIDTNSKGQDIFFSGMFVLNIYLIATESYRLAAFLGLLAMLPIVGKHRGWTHTRLAMLAVPLPILVLPYLFEPTRPWLGAPYYGAAVVGIMSHLLLDGLLFRKLRMPRHF